MRTGRESKPLPGLAAGFALALACTAPAAAATVCKTIRTLVADAPNGFAIARAKVSAEGSGEGRDPNAPAIYMATLKPWTTACRISDQIGYSCSFHYETEAQAVTNYKATLLGIHGCFPGMPVIELDQPAFSHMKLIDGVVLSVVGGRASLEISAAGGSGGWAVVFRIPNAKVLS